MVELLAALILSKFVIVAVISLAAGALANGQGLDAVLAGAALLLTAGFAPFVLLRLVPLAEAGAIGHLEGLERRPVNVAATGALRVAGLAMAGSAGDGGFTADAAGFSADTHLAAATATLLPDPPPVASEGPAPPDHAVAAPPDGEGNAAHRDARDGLAAGED
jgi:hypothetical protein